VHERIRISNVLQSIWPWEFAMWLVLLESMHTNLASRKIMGDMVPLRTLAILVSGYLSPDPMNVPVAFGKGTFRMGLGQNPPLKRPQGHVLRSWALCIALHANDQTFALRDVLGVQKVDVQMPPPRPQQLSPLNVKILPQKKIALVIASGMRTIA